MRLVLLPNGHEINPEKVVAIRFDPAKPKLEIWLGPSTALLELRGDDAIAALEVIRQHQDPDPPAIHRTMTGREDICRRIADLERAMEIDGAGIDIGKRLAAVDARLMHVEARVSEAEEGPDGPPRPAAEPDVGSWTPKVDDRVRVRASQLHATVVYVGNGKISLRYDGDPMIYKGFTPEELEPAPEPPAPDAHALAERIVDTLWGSPYPDRGADQRRIHDRAEATGGPRAARVEWVAERLAEFAGAAPADPPEPIDPDAPRRFRWSYVDGFGGWNYGVFWPASRTTYTDKSTWLGADPTKLFGKFEWIDPEPTPAPSAPIPEPGGSKDKADIVPESCACPGCGTGAFETISGLWRCAECECLWRSDELIPAEQYDEHANGPVS